MKLRMPIEQVCGPEAPLEFANYMYYVRSLRFEDRPDYNSIRSIFKRLMKKEGYEYDHMFDWVIANQERALGNSGHLHHFFSVESFDQIKQSNRQKASPPKSLDPPPQQEGQETAEPMTAEDKKDSEEKNEEVN